MAVTLLAAVVGVLAAARLVRLVVADHWPPAVWAVERVDARLPETWRPLLSCPYCLAPWMCALVGAPVLVWGLTPVWWAVCGWLAAAYAAAWIVRADIAGG